MNHMNPIYHCKSRLLAELQRSQHEAAERYRHEIIRFIGKLFENQDLCSDLEKTGNDLRQSGLKGNVHRLGIRISPVGGVAARFCW